MDDKDLQNLLRAAYDSDLQTVRVRRSHGPSLAGADREEPLQIASLKPHSIAVFILGEYSRCTQAVRADLVQWLSNVFQRPLAGHTEGSDSAQAFALPFNRDDAPGAARDLLTRTPERIAEIMTTECSRFSQRLRECLLSERPTRRQEPALANGKNRLLLAYKVAASILLVVLILSTYKQVLALAAEKEKNRRLEASLAQMEAALIVEPIPVFDADAARQQMIIARKVAILPQEQDHSNRLTLRLSPLVSQYYEAVEIVWDPALDPEPAEIYYRGHRFSPQVSHEYSLPRHGGTRRVDIKLVYYFTGEAIEQFSLSRKTEETISLLLTSTGIAETSNTVSPGLTASVTRPLASTPDGDIVVNDDIVPVEMQLAGTEATVGAQGEDRFLYLLVRATDGSDPRLIEEYTVEDWKLRLSDLVKRGAAKQHAFETWVTLPGINPNAGSRAGQPTRFEILLIELPRLIRDKHIPKGSFNLSNRELRKDVVRLELFVVYDPVYAPIPP